MTNANDVNDTNSAPALRETVAAGAPDTPDPKIGATLSGRYLIESRLGAGAMGVVYRGEHTMMRKAVAIKVLQGDVSNDSEIAQRFQREAQAAGHIDHPNICAATDFGRTETGELFMVMEYLEGRTLTEELAVHGSLSPLRAVSICAQLCAALEAAHALGVIHRDLKPDNIMLVGTGEDERVKVMDFGVASVSLEGIQDDVRLTRAGAVYGTPAYMAPEQVTGADVDARADLYALGVLLYECLTGDLPFQAQTATQMMSLHLTANAPPLPDSTPPRLRALAASLLEKEAGDRPESAHAASLALSSSLEFDAPAPLLEPPAKARSRARINVALALVAACVCGLVALAGGLVLALGASTGGDSTPGERDANAASVAAASLSEERDAFMREADLSSALESLARDDHAAADAELSRAAELHPGSGHVLYYQGVAAMAQGDEKLALERYGAAISADTRYADDSMLLSDALTMLGDRSKATRRSAREFVETSLKSSRGLDAALTELAREGESSRARSAAYDLLEARGALERIEPAERLRLELGNASGCRSKEKLVEQIEALGDPSLIPDLERLERTRKQGCGLFDLEDCLKCARPEIKSALETLRAATK